MKPRSTMCRLGILVACLSLTWSAAAEDPPPISEWLVLGSLPFTRDTDPFVAPPPARLLEVAPQAGDVLGSLRWSRVSANPDGGVDLISVGVEPEEIASAFMLAYVHSPAEQTVMISVGSDDGIQVFVNGVETHTNWTLRGFRPDQDRFLARLGSGWNRLLLRVANNTGGFAGSARILGAGGKGSAPGVRATAERPADYRPTRTAAFLQSITTAPGDTLRPSADGLAFPLHVATHNLGTTPAAGVVLEVRDGSGAVAAHREVDLAPGQQTTELLLDPAAVARNVADGLAYRLVTRPQRGPRREQILDLGGAAVLRVVTADPPLRPGIGVDGADVRRMLTDWRWGQRFLPEQFVDGEERFRRLLHAYVKSDGHAWAANRGDLQALIDRGASEIRKQRITFIGNSHIDMAWLWPRSETIEVVDMTYDQALKFIDEFPFFMYAQSQMQTFEWVRTLFPEMMRRMDEAVRAGKFIPVGGMWVEPDCNLPSGESFVRQLFYGKHWVRDRWGIDIRVGWNPDSFGYAWTLPMIFKGAGVDYFVTQKIGWNDTTTFPHRLFRWQAPDGSSVLSYFPFNYVDDAQPWRLANWMEEQQEQQPGLVDMYDLYGVGDHGGGPTRAMIERYQEMGEIATFPQVEHAAPEPVMERFERDYGDRVPVWNDELYLEYHRGTFTTQGEMKRRNRGMESALETTEKLASLAATLVPGYDYPDAKLDGAWLRTLFNQFHDILPGSSIPEVFVDARADYDEAEQLVAAARQGALARLAPQVDTAAGQGVPVVVWNPLSWARSEIVALPRDAVPFDGRNLRVTDGSGHVEPVQLLDDRLLFVARDVPGIGYRTFWIQKRSAPTSTATVRVEEGETSVALGNGLLRATIDLASGDVTSLRLSEGDRELLATGQGGGNVLQLFGDIPDQWDAWNIGYTGESWNSERPATLRVLDAGPLVARVRVERTIGQSTVVQDYVVDVVRPLLDIHTRADWDEEHKFLKTAFFVAADVDRATFEIPYGTIERTTRPRSVAERARWEVPGQRWVDVTDRSGRFGLTLVNDSKYGYDVLGSTLRLSLLRAPKYPDPEADIGEHRFAYALYPHAGDWKAAQSHRRGAEFNLPLVPFVTQRSPGPLPPEQALVAVDANHVVVSTIKAVRARADRPAFAIRLFEVEGRTATATIELPFAIAAAWTANLMEDRQERLPVDGRRVEVTIGPHRLKTIVVRPAD